MPSIGLDVHRDFCEVAIAESGGVRLAGRVATDPEALELFARSLGREDQVALEATANGLAIARLIEPHVARVRSPPRSARARLASWSTRTSTARAGACDRVCQQGASAIAWA